MMMRNLLFCIILILICNNVYSQQRRLLDELDQVLLKKDGFTAEKIKHIDHLKKSLLSTRYSARYEQYVQIFDEYKMLNFDSAFVYATKLQELAKDSKDPIKINLAKKHLSFILLSSGMFKETLGILDDINVNALEPGHKTEYYILKARCYYDLANFVNNNHFGSIYNTKGNQLADSAVLYAQKNSYKYNFISGLRNLRSGNIDLALRYYQNLINRPDLSLHEYAVIASTLSYLYSFNDKGNESLDLLIKSAIADAKSSTKETYALFKLSDTLFKAGDTQRAYKYIKAAMQDAQYYGARHRQFEVGTLFRIIEGRQLVMVENQKNQVMKYAVTVTLLILAIIIFIIIVIKQNEKLKLAQTSIFEANITLKQTNLALGETNSALREANKIKDEYIGYYFNINAEYIDKIDRFKKSVSQKLVSHQYDDIKLIISRIDLKKEREDLSQSFDKVFLKLFPNFVEDFNTFFKDQDKVRLEHGQLLNTELRIFALIRLGIHDNDRISKILNYSVNTIYSYKTRIKNKAIISNQEFEQKIMDIKAV